MPLFTGKKAFGKNVATEESAGKAPKQALAIAYGMKKRAPKKMATGGTVKFEARPMPQERFDDAHEMHSEPKAKMPTVKSEPRARLTPTTPRIAQGATFKTRPSGEFSYDAQQRELKMREADLMAMKPQAAITEPMHDEEDEVAHMEGKKPHPLKMMAKGGHVSMEVGEMPEEDGEEHPEGMEDSDNESMRPSVDEYMAAKFASGGMVDEDDQPEDEEEEEHHASVAAAIMARQKYADGGVVDIEENGEEEPNSYDPANKAALKENYDEDLHSVSEPMDSHGDELMDEDEHDMVSRLMSKMRKKSPISK